MQFKRHFDIIQEQFQEIPDFDFFFSLHVLYLDIVYIVHIDIKLADFDCGYYLYLTKGETTTTKQCRTVCTRQGMCAQHGLTGISPGTVLNKSLNSPGCAQWQTSLCLLI